MQESGIIRQLHRMAEHEGKELRDGARAVSAQLGPLIERIRLSSLRRIYILGCGTSYYGAMNVKGAFEALTGLSSESAEAFAFAAYQNPDLIDEGCLVLGFFTSGEADAVVEAFQKCRERKARTVAITAIAESSVGCIADEVLLTGATDEVKVPRTKAQIQGMIAMYLMAIAVGRASGYLHAARAEQAI